MKKTIKAIIYGIVSVVWLYFSVLFSTALWLDSPGSNSWREDSVFIPLGIIMFVAWTVSLIIFIRLIKSKKVKSASTEE